MSTGTLVDLLITHVKTTFFFAETNRDVKNDNVVELKRELNLLSACNLIISSIIGTGIFVSPSSILGYSGSVGLSLVIWVVSGVLSLLGMKKI